MSETVVAQRDARSYRLTNIDMLRGLVLVIMAIDHTRDFFHMGALLDPMNNPEISPLLYVTRWITHFCAPVFVFLAGTSIGLMEGRKTKNELSLFVLKRGLWIIFVEFFILSPIVSFAPFGDEMLGGHSFTAMQVLWALGASMVILSGAMYLGTKGCLIVGLIIVVGSNLLDPIWPQGSLTQQSDQYWLLIHSQTSFIIGPFLFMVIYPLLSWVGVMMLGYGSSYIFQKPVDERNSYLIRTGITMIGLFLIIRLADIYGDPNHWQAQGQGLVATIFDFMNVSKYPASFLFLLITLGPMAILCGYADKMSGFVKDILVMFGRVPFVFYLCHFLLLHILATLYGLMSGFEFHQFQHPFFMNPPNFGFAGLGAIYLIWLVVVTLLYPLCKWVADIKKRRKDWWLSYL
jgi:uncharacterized membrane protein